MFSNKGHFSKIPCPVGSDCDLIVCFFLHDGQPTTDADAMEVEPVAASSHAQAKRVKVTSQTTESIPSSLNNTVQATPAFMGTLISQKPQPNKASAVNGSSKAPTSDQPTALPSSHAPLIASEARPVSPPPHRKPQQGPASTPSKAPGLPIKHTTEPLTPRMLVQAPASHQTRTLYLKKLHEEMCRLNDQARKEPAMRAVVLESAQLKTLALDEEQKIAQDHFSVYGNIIKLRMVAYKKMSAEQWKLHLLETCSVGESAERQKTRSIIKGERVLETGLSESEERQILPRFFAKLHGLEKFGYVTGAPTDEEIEEVKQGDEVNGGWEKCCRCQTRFQVFPDRRDEDGALTSGGKCVYHPGRIVAGGRGRETVHGCCNDPLGRSVGCDSYPCHVFKVDNPARLATVMQYQYTPDNAEISNDKAVSMDCEMGYTTNGFELIRLTMLSWPKGEKVLDVLVRPLGYLLDPNTRFSGVSAQQFQDAVPYDPAASAETRQIVGSPIEARGLFFKHINPSTPVVGHGLDNDMAALRVIHPCIVDTALLCPHSRGLPFRRALKQLSQDYLFRTIQNAGLAGHDSAEDAKAAGDIALELIKRKWKKMKDEGWKSEDGKLVTPKIPLPDHHDKAVKNGELRSQEETEKQAELSLMEDQRNLEEKNTRKRTRDDQDDAMGESERVVLDYD